MSELDWFAVLWLGAAVAYLTVIGTTEADPEDPDRQEAGGAGDAGTHD
jgi:hypothetical protein